MMDPTAVLTLALPWLSKQALKALEALGARWLEALATDQTRKLQVRLRLAPPLDERALKLAWITYVQLVTRISIVPIPDDQGFDREALSSLHALFTRLRDALEEVGPTSANQRSDGGTPIGVVVAVLLNVVLRPFLSHWHPRLEQHEAACLDGASKWDHEQAWPEHPEFREQLAVLQDGLVQLAAALEALMELEPLASLRERGRVPELNGSQAQDDAGQG
jgi:hypothetical protein